MRLPRQRIWPILPGESSFLNYNRSHALSTFFLSVAVAGGGANRTFAGMSYTVQPSAWPVKNHILRVRTDYCSVGDEEVAEDQN